MKKLKNSVSFITGIGEGMGKAIALTFAVQNNKVNSADKDSKKYD